MSLTVIMNTSGKTVVSMDLANFADSIEDLVGNFIVINGSPQTITSVTVKESGERVEE